VKTVCAYSYPGCSMPKAAAPAGELVSHGLCEQCAVKVRSEMRAAKAAAA